MKPKTIRLAALYSHPIQYFAPLFRELATYPGIDLTVYYCTRQGLDVSVDPGFGQAFSWDVPLLEGYRHVFLKNLRDGSKVDGFFQLVNPGIVNELVREHYDAILVHGYEHQTKWFAFFAAVMTRTPILLRGESNLLVSRTPPVCLSKLLVLGFLMRLIKAGLYIGQNNFDYYRHYGLPAERLFFTPYVVDNDFFQTQAKLLEPHRRELRAQWGVMDDRPIFLACGKLSAIKQPLLLLRAFQRIRQQSMCALLYAGDGALRNQVEKVVREENIPDVTITGFLNQSRISEAYTAADILVLPSSSEPWGLVVNEAMNFGLPIVTSNQVGCARDLVRPNKNGYTFDYRSIDQLTEILSTLMTDAERRRRYSRCSIEIIAEYTLSRVAKTIADVAQNC